MRIVLTGVLVLAAAGAQGPDPGRGRGRFGPPPGPGPEGDVRFLGGVPGRPGRVVTNAPYSGDVVTETTQVLPDGNRIHQVSTVHVARDSAGRTRTEQALRNLGGLAPNANLPEVIFINDPVASVNYALNPSGHTATKSSWRAGPPQNREMMRRFDAGTAAKSDGGGRRFPDGADANVKTESLGRQTIEGVVVDGTRTTQTIPAGRIGNDQPIQIVTETWYSADLKTPVQSKRTDPRTGETVTRLTNLSRVEPAHSLFEVPADYKVTEMANRPSRSGAK